MHLQVSYVRSEYRYRYASSIYAHFFTESTIHFSCAYGYYNMIAEVHILYPCTNNYKYSYIKLDPDKTAIYKNKRHINIQSTVEPLISGLCGTKRCP